MTLRREKSPGRVAVAASLANHGGWHNRGHLMSVQPPVAPHRVAIADMDIPFWRMVAIMIKWSLAAIPAVIVISIIFSIIGAVFGGVLYAIFGTNIPGMKL
jgi:hypothetical protein